MELVAVLPISSEIAISKRSVSGDEDTEPLLEFSNDDDVDVEPGLTIGQDAGIRIAEGFHAAGNGAHGSSYTALGISVTATSGQSVEAANNRMDMSASAVAPATALSVRRTNKYACLCWLSALGVICTVILVPVLRMTLRTGSESTGSEPVVVVSESLTRTYVHLTSRPIATNQQVTTPTTSFWWTTRKESGGDACSAAYRPLYVNSTNGRITSPNYPGDYYNNADCQWLIDSGSADKSVRFLVIEFFTERLLDGVKLYDGSSTSSSVLATLTGPYTSMPSYSSTQRYMMVRFTSDNSLTYRGFSATYSFTTASDAGGNACSALYRPMRVNSTNGRITSPNYPGDYYNNADCQWLIDSGSANKSVRLSVIDFYTERLHDVVTLYDGGSTSSSVLATLTGTYYSLMYRSSYSSTQRFMVVRFKSDGTLTYRGFSATYSITTVSETGGDTCSAVFLNSTNGQIKSPNYPGDYFNNADCQWTIDSGSTDKTVRFAITDFRTEEFSDIVTLYDGNSTSTRLIATLTGTYYLNMPRYSSTQRYMLVRFKSDDSLTYRGFSAYYTTSTEDSISDGCSEVLVGGNGTLTSPNYPINYPNNVLCQWLIDSGGNMSNFVVFFTVTDFLTEGQRDSLVLYDGNSTASPIIASLSGSLTVLPSHSSTQRYLLLRFSTDYSVTYRGFRATYARGCSLSSMKCHTGGCIPSSAWCNGYPDCPDDSDEPTGCNGTCPTSMTSARVCRPLRKCIFADRICDRVSDCPDGSDEVNCNFSTIACSALSRPLLIGSGNGTITSPNYPSDYYDNAHCEWLIDSGSNSSTHVVLLTVTELFTESPTDLLTVFDGNSTASRMIASLSGRINDLLRYNSTQRYLLVRFTADATEVFRGFSASYSIGCSMSSFKCLTGDCVPSSAWCNGYQDCPDNSDEPHGCNGTCPLGLTSAKMCQPLQTCIFASHICNAVRDCPDGSDEVDCNSAASACSAVHRPLVIPGGNGTITSPNFPRDYYNGSSCGWLIYSGSKSSTFVVSLTVSDFRTEYSHDSLIVYDGGSISSPVIASLSGSPLTMPSYTSTQRLMLITFMTDSSITARGFRASYASVCSSFSLKCRTGQECLPPSAWCNGYPDCSDNSDEIPGCNGTCPPHMNSTRVCRQLQKCIFPAEICNGVQDCPDGSDEVNCVAACPSNMPSARECRPLRRCIYASQVCNSVQDCPDDSDEVNCTCSIIRHYKCMNGRCISKHWMCDGVNDCPMGDDESSPLCSRCSGSSKQFQCVRTTNTCISAVQRCDGTAQCPDLTDESGCLRLNSSTNQLHVFSHGVSSLLVCAVNWTTAASDAVCRHLGHRSALSTWNIDESFYNAPDSDRWVSLSPNANLSMDILKHLGKSTCPTTQSVAITCASNDVCGQRSPNIRNYGPYIINGQWAERGAWPWHAMLTIDDAITCGGTMLNDRWILTAGHCTRSDSGKAFLKYQVRLGSTISDGVDSDLVLASVDAVFTHPSYDAKLITNDVALLRLDRSISLSDTIRPICLPTSDVSLSNFKLCVAIGFGRTSYYGLTSSRLLQARMNIIPMSQCYSSMTTAANNSHFALYNNTALCLGPSVVNDVSTCMGDSGGSLSCLDERDVWTVVGVTSFGSKQCTTSCSARVPTFVNWIQQTIASNQGG